MPTYQYACTACGHQLEAVQSFTDAALTECPACTGRLRKLYSAVGIVFKGSGFYRNDSRPAEASASSSGSTSSAKDGGSKDSSTAASSTTSSSSTESTGSSSTPASSGSSTSKATTSAA